MNKYAEALLMIYLHRRMKKALIKRAKETGDTSFD